MHSALYKLYVELPAAALALSAKLPYLPAAAGQQHLTSCTACRRAAASRGSPKREDSSGVGAFLVATPVEGPLAGVSCKRHHASLLAHVHAPRATTYSNARV